MPPSRVKPCSDLCVAEQETCKKHTAWLWGLFLFPAGSKGHSVAARDERKGLMFGRRGRPRRIPAADFPAWYWKPELPSPTSESGCPTDEGPP